MVSMEHPRNSRTDQARWELDKVRCYLEKQPSPNREIRGIGEILADVLEGLDEPVPETVLVLRDAWSELAGPQISRHSRPIALENFTLRICVDHPGWLAEIERTKRLLLRKLQAGYPSLGIRQLQLELGHR